MGKAGGHKPQPRRVGDGWIKLTSKVGSEGTIECKAEATFDPERIVAEGPIDVRFAMRVECEVCGEPDPAARPICDRDHRNHILCGNCFSLLKDRTRDCRNAFGEGGGRPRCPDTIGRELRIVAAMRRGSERSLIFSTTPKGNASEIYKAWMEKHGSVRDAHKILVLDELEMPKVTNLNTRVTQVAHDDRVMAMGLAMEARKRGE